MKCSEAQALLVDLLYEELAAEERSRLMAHLEGCGECGERWIRLRALSVAADRWTAPPLPRGITERALARVASERAREASRSLDRSGRLPPVPAASSECHGPLDGRGNPGRRAGGSREPWAGRVAGEASVRTVARGVGISFTKPSTVKEETS